jgi:hypothetical protein
MVTADQIVEGVYFSDTPAQARGEAVVDLVYARQHGIAVGDATEPAGEGEAFEVVGLARAPLGGQASQAYVELGRLQELSVGPGALPSSLIECFADEGFDIESPNDIHTAPQEVVEACFTALHQDQGS